MSYGHLMAPGAIGPLAVRNRIVMPAMDQNTCDDGEITDLTIAHYEARARGGVGLLILETSAVAWPVGATSLHQPGLSDDRFVPGLERLARAVHKHGAKMVVQVCHHGKTAGVDAMQGREQLVPSLPLPEETVDIGALTNDELMRMAALTGGRRATQRAATEEDLEWVVGQFADAAARVQAAGHDGVEVHAAHGYLLSSFLSPRFNARTDRWGGSVENRARLMTDVVSAIRARCGDGFAVIVRLDGREYADGGITPELAARHAQLAVDAGAHAIHVSAIAPNALGAGFTDGPVPWEADQYVPLATEVKKAVRVPVIGVGRILPDAAEHHLESRHLDFVAMGRQLLADPETASKLLADRPQAVRTCINCYVCVAQNFWDGTPVCAVNAELGHYDDGPITPTETPRTVAVVGGGPGGMEAARVAALRGHHVVLFEQADELGGTARFSALTTPMNAELVRYLSQAVQELDVEVRTGASATPAAVRATGADVVVVATGARRERPAVPGADLPHVLTGDDLRGLLAGDPEAGRRLSFGQRAAVAVGRRAGMTSTMGRVRGFSKRWMPIGKEVVVLGGGLVGLELAEFLAERGRHVTVLEAGDKMGVEMAHPRRARALFEARAHGVELVTGAEVTAITESRVEYLIGERERVAEADHVVVASGVVPDRGLAEAMEAAGLEVHVVGDAGRVGYIEGAVRSGHLAGRAV